MVHRRALFTAVLCAYVAVLVLAAWPDPIRPAFLDPPHDLASRMLRLVGWKAGQNVFAIPERVDETYRAFCIRVKAELRGGGETGIGPADGRCPYARIRLHTPASEIFEVHILRLAWKTRKVTRSRHPMEIEMLGSLGRYYCRRAREQGLDATAVVLAEYAWMESYADGSIRRQPLVAYDWSCDVGQLRTVHYGMTPQELSRFWGGTPWL